ncbi:MAG: AbrB/MazE/SpoVT family DNA-binding domain-containing protein [Candidatus Korarchaeota archaeon NZ13-K]|nr:MAG: AbrB/MazE/SpoVT family DNA-binding domain-containing protein [Candidatus Korarchaeota archaeon NZ13-K]
MSRLYVRNLQLTGNATYIVSIPKDWVRKLGLEKGSKVYLELMQDGSLRLYGSSPKRAPGIGKSFELGRGDDPNSLIRRILAAYIAGFSTVTLSFDPELKESAFEIRRFLESSVLGFNVLRESRSEFTFYAVVDEDAMRLSDTLGKLRENVHHMLEDMHSGMGRNDVKVLERVIEEDQIVDKLYLLVAKQVTRMLMNPLSVESYGLRSAAEAPQVFLAARSMERIADHAVLMARESLEVITSGGRIPGWLLEDFISVLDLFDSSTRLLLEPDEVEAEESARRIDDALKLIRGRRVEDSRIQMLLNSMERILGYTMNVLEAVIDIIMIREFAELSG